jgi:hypothetical protein
MRMIQEDDQLGPLIQRVAHGFAQRTLRGAQRADLVKTELVAGRKI